MELDTTTTASDSHQRKRKWTSGVVAPTPEPVRTTTNTAQDLVEDEAGAIAERPAFPVTKVVLSKTGIGYFERYNTCPPKLNFILFYLKN
jgi:hypothetical protein